MEGLLIALLIQLGNRFGPEAIFKFIFFAAGLPGFPLVCAWLFPRLPNLLWPPRLLQ